MQVSFDSYSQLQATHAICYTKDVKFVKPSLTPKHPRSKRQSIEFFSESSQRRLLVLSRNEGHRIKSQTCLTYHQNMPKDGKEVKKQLNTFLTLLRRDYPDIIYLWVLEFQKRGFPHFHLFTNICPSNRDFHMWCAYTWNHLLKESESHFLWQAHHTNFMPWSMVSGKYLVKEYLAKASQKIVPEEYHNVGRFWGNSRNMKLQKFLVIPGESCDPESFVKSLRIVSKYKEKQLKKYFKTNYRNRARSYSLPNLTDIFIQLIQYFDNEKQIEENNNDYIRMPN